MSLGVNELKPKTYFIHEDQPCVVLEAHHLKMQQRRPVVQTKFRNLLTGKLLERNFAQSDSFKEADVSKSEVKFLYGHRDEYWFAEPNDPSQRFQLGADIIGDQTRFLKDNTILEAVTWNEKIINVTLPVKMEFTVVEAPPSTKGDTQSGGTKPIKLDTGATINAPLFIGEGERIVVNTQTGEYSERAEIENAHTKGRPVPIAFGTTGGLCLSGSADLIVATPVLTHRTVSTIRCVPRLRLDFG